MYNTEKEKGKNMKIGIFTKKGGAGKSTIAVSLYDYFKDYIVVSNDNAGKFDNFDFYHKGIDIRNVTHNGVIAYDFGGYEAPEILDIIQECDIVIIPTLNDDPSYLQELVEATDEIKEVNNNIIFVINASDSSTLAQAVIEDRFKDEYPYISIRQSKGFKNGVWTGTTITQLQKEGGRLGYVYQNVVKDVESLAKLIKIMTGVNDG